MNQTTVVTESELQRALDCGELIRLYQPVIDVRTGTPVQVEALLRWDHPARGLLAPGEFLVDEDDSTLLVRIGWSVVIEAARRAGTWRRAFPERPITVTVNLFDDHLERRDLPNRIEHLMHDHEVPTPRGLAFELGEHNLLSGGRRMRDRITILHNSGVEVVVDDLGAAAATTDVAPDMLLDWATELFAIAARVPARRGEARPALRGSPRGRRPPARRDRGRARVGDRGGRAGGGGRRDGHPRSTRRFRPRAGLPLRPARASGPDRRTARRSLTGVR